MRTFLKEDVEFIKSAILRMDELKYADGSHLTGQDYAVANFTVDCMLSFLPQDEFDKLTAERVEHYHTLALAMAQQNQSEAS